MLDGEPLGYAFALLAGLFFGLSDALVRAASVRLKPLENLSISLLVGTPLLWFFALAKGSTSVDSTAMVYFILAGLLNFVVGRLLFYIAITSLGATTASILASPTVIVSAILAWLLLGESLSAIQMTGIVLVMIAVSLASFRPSGKPLHNSKTTIGVVAGIGSTVVFAITAILVRSAAGYLNADPLTGVAISYTSALPVALLLERGPLRPGIMPRRELLYMVAAGVIVALAQLSRYQALNLTWVAKASVIISLFPLFTLLFSYVLRGEAMEEPSAVHLIAGVMAVAGIFLTNYYGGA
ncbi:MAG: DMT family transporter [Desulfurococcales archaeon]|nr:DMT family transporter [Desulfurococcales archaeon]